MLDIINSAALHCVGFGVSVLLNNFSTMAMGGRRGVPWCNGYQSEGCTNYIHFCLASRSATWEEHSYVILLCKSIEISTFSLQSMYRLY